MCIRDRLHGIRSVLYETARFVDMYKTYYHISKERALDKDERNEMKEYQKLADIYTPLQKLFASEYANEITYDALQIHGGSGFMKDYPIPVSYTHLIRSELQVTDETVKAAKTGTTAKMPPSSLPLLPFPFSFPPLPPFHPCLLYTSRCV